MKIYSILVLLVLFTFGCNSNKSKTPHKNDATGGIAGIKKYSQHTIKEINITKTVDIDSFILITDDIEADREDAKEIMEIKRKWPLAMQTKDRNLFNEILAKDFTFRSVDEFYYREDYIHDRVQSPVIVDTAQYQNLVLQFFNETALLTYRNIVKRTRCKRF
jgi:hypothetical protein